ncbi:MAG: helix-turn-helix domain-containing protein [Tepidisphaera sp.]
MQPSSTPISPSSSAPRAQAVTTEASRPLVDYVTAAGLLGVSVRTARTLVKTGLLPAIRIRRRVLIDPADVTAFIARAKAEAR